MRFLQPTGLAAALVSMSLLTGCMGSGGSSSVPSGLNNMAAHTQTQSVERGSAHLALASNTPTSTGCPSSDFACVAGDASTPATIEICITTNGDCSDPYGEWNWSVTMYNLKGKAIKAGKPPYGSFSPDEDANPSTLTVSGLKNAKEAKKPKVKFVAAISACNSTSGCIGGNVGIQD
jgi:hypothetical protein